MKPGEKRQYKTLRSIFFQGNTVGNLAGNVVAERFKEAELIIASNFDFNDTVRIADIVLPAAQWFEVDDMVMPGNHMWVTWNQKAIDPLYECKSNFEIWNLIAEGLGYGDEMKETNDQVLQQIIDSNDSIKDRLPKLEELKEKRFTRIVDDDFIYGDEKFGGFRTPTGRVEFYLQSPTQLIDFGNPDEFDPEQYRLPKFVAPDEGWNYDHPDYPQTEYSRKYPFIFSQMHTKYRAQNDGMGHLIIISLVGFVLGLGFS